MKDACAISDICAQSTRIRKSYSALLTVTPSAMPMARKRWVDWLPLGFRLASELTSSHTSQISQSSHFSDNSHQTELFRKGILLSRTRGLSLYIQLPSQPDRKCQHACSQIRSLSRHGRGVLCKCTKRNPLIQSGTMTDHEIIIAYTLLATSSARSLVELNSFPTLPTIPIYRRG
jgi:hypothetical protein